MAYIPSDYFPEGYFPPLYFAEDGGIPPTDPYTLPFGAKFVYKALGLPIPTTQEEADESVFPPEMFQDELVTAASLLISEYPCIVTNNIVNLTGTELLLYEMAVGYSAAEMISGGNASAPGVAGPQMVKRKLLDIEYTWKTIDPKDRASGWQSMIDRYMWGISCVNGGRSDIGAGLLVAANPNRDDCGRLIDNEGRLY